MNETLRPTLPSEQEALRLLVSAGVIAASENWSLAAVKAGNLILELSKNIEKERKIAFEPPGNPDDPNQNKDENLPNI